MYTFPFLITKDSKLIVFQYNITHHILPTNSSLFRAGITESDTCTLCKTEKQTINHLLFHCTESTVFWKEFTSWWLLKFKQAITLTECVVLYGYHNNIKNKQALNVTLLLAKYHIFATSSCDGKLSFDSFPPPKPPRDFKTKLYSRKQIMSIFIYVRQSVAIHCFVPFPTILRYLTKIDVFAFVRFCLSVAVVVFFSPNVGFAP